GVPLKKARPNRRPGCPVEDQLRAGDHDVIANVTAEVLQTTMTHREWRPRRGRSRAAAERRKRIRFVGQIWITPLETAARTDVRQRLRTDFNHYAFGSSDLFQRAPNIGILLERKYHRLVNTENRRASFRPSEIALAQGRGLNGDGRSRRRNSGQRR